MDYKDILKQTKKDLKEFKTLVGRIKVNRLILEKDVFSDEQRKSIEKNIKTDRIKIEKIKAALELLNEMDLKIITGSFFENINNKYIAIDLNVTIDTVYRHKGTAIKKIADIMYSHLVDSCM